MNNCKNFTAYTLISSTSQELIYVFNVFLAVDLLVKNLRARENTYQL
ncbi:MAG: hypothetical protein AB8B67_04145 [Rickettsiaceae bacterium]